MTFKQGEYTLYTMNVNLKGGRKQTIYFFSKGKPKSGTPCDKPTNMNVGINKKTGLPYLKKN